MRKFTCTTISCLQTQLQARRSSGAQLKRLGNHDVEQVCRIDPLPYLPLPSALRASLESLAPCPVTAKERSGERGARQATTEDPEEIHLLFHQRSQRSERSMTMGAPSSGESGVLCGQVITASLLRSCRLQTQTIRADLLLMANESTSCFGSMGGCFGAQRTGSN